MSDTAPTVATPTAASPWTKVVAASVGFGLVLTLLLLAFTWPGKTTEPRNLPIAVAGPAAAAAPVAEELGRTGSFDVSTVADRDAALAQIRTRESYGAVVLAGPGRAPEVLTASAAGAAPAAILKGVAAQLQAQVDAQAQAAGGQAATVVVTDVVALSKDDATGAGLGTAAFPMAMGGILGGVLAALLLVGVAQRIVGVALYATVGGLLAALVLHTWFGYLAGAFVTSWAAVSLAIAATGYLVAGLHAVLGRPGIALGAIFTMLLGNPLASAAGPWQFIAEPWGLVGQYLVPGAGAALLRTTSYFPDASVAQQWWTLTAYVVAGLALLLVGTLRERRVN